MTLQIIRTGLLAFLLLVAACNDDPDAVNVVEIAQIPTVIPSPHIVVNPLPPITPTPTAIASRTPIPTELSTIPTIEASATTIPQPTHVPLVPIVIAMQPIPAGAPIPPEAVTIVDWPMPAAPYDSIGVLDDVIGEVALVDIGCYEPILSNTIAYREIGTGYDDLPGACAPYQPATGMVSIVIVKQDISAGTPIEPNIIALHPWPVSAQSQGMFYMLSEVIGTVANTDIRRGQPVTISRLASS